MLISLKHKFIFVANTKVASTSVESALAKYCQISLVDPPNLKHMTYVDIVKNFDFLFSQKKFNINNFYKFGIFRDPGDWIISWFNYRSRLSLKGYKNYLGDIEFEDFLNNLEDWVSSQRRFFVDDQSQNAMNFLVDYSHIDFELNRVLRDLGIKESIVLPRENISKKIRITKNNLPDYLLKKIELIFAKDYIFKKAYINSLDQKNVSF